MVGPTVHPQLMDVLLKFRTHRVAHTPDISKIYRAVQLTQSDKDYHRFVWRKNPDQPLRDYRMTRDTFGVAASCFADNISAKRNALELSQEYTLWLQKLHKSFSMWMTDLLEQTLYRKPSNSEKNSNGYSQELVSS